MNAENCGRGADVPRARRAGLGLAVLVLASGVVGGCSFLEDLRLSGLAQAGDHKGVIEFVERQIAAGRPVSTYQLGLLCDATYKAKRYDKMLWAADLLQKNIDAGRTGYMGMGNYAPVPPLLRGAAYLDMGQYARARQEATRALSLLEGAGRAAWTTYTHFKIDALQVLGIASAIEGDHELASKSVRQLEAMQLHYPLELQRRHRRTAIARIHMASRDFEAALAATRHAEAVKFRGVIESLVVDWTFEDLPLAFISAKCLYETNQTADAEAAYRKLLSHPAIEQFGEMHWVILYDLGRIERVRRRPDESIRHLRKAVEIIERQRSSIHTDAGRIGFVGDKQAVYHQIVALLLDQGRADEAFAYAERAKARALVDLLAAQRQAISAGARDPEVGKLVTRLAAAQEDLQAAGRPGGMDGRDRTRGVLIGLRQELVRAAPELASLVTVTNTSVRSIQRLLASDEALVEFFYSDVELFAFVLTREDITASRLKRVGLEADVRAFRRAVSQPASRAYMATSQALYARLLGPLRGRLAERRLTIVPHGLLHYIPFSALHSGQEYLIDRHSVRVLPSASVLGFLQRRRTIEAGMLALGNPDLGKGKLDLPSAQEEAVSVAKMVKPSRLLLRKDATETFVKDHGGRFGMLHFATHGTFDPANPLRSALLLAPDSRNDGFLRVGELYGLRLNAELVTLSGCQTAMGKVANGDDVVGFTRGLLYAGTRSIVSSLWNVPDKATRDLMIDFYANLPKVGKQESLRQAQLRIKEKRPHPYYWAAFLLTGKSR